jgi:predicted nucleic acid-binding protein
MDLVVDASMTLAWLFIRSKSEEEKIADRALLALSDTEAFVPSLWHTEIANALLVGERRGVVTPVQVFEYLDRLSALPLVTDDIAPVNRRELVMALAREYKLTAYDATYLDLALRRNAVLATFDSQLAEAMRQAGGTVFGD